MAQDIGVLDFAGKGYLNHPPTTKNLLCNLTEISSSIPSTAPQNQDLPALPFLECVDLPLQLSGVDQAPQDVVVEIPEAQGDPAQVLEP
ncbi:hypothetical protein I4J29_11105, partial [Corynebacterium diphtheriae bv. mitis]|nr:hypothetical protein [Corynebacterium diphtheriae bv. gravis]MBG9324890.1 hypothetical protein [Corynebacterium diphtheriae bv. mitis]MBG9341216.1 hypothetical protein [Corynebacterium diphtheriae bv. mitis]